MSSAQVGDLPFEQLHELSFPNCEEAFCARLPPATPTEGEAAKYVLATFRQGCRLYFDREGDPAPPAPPGALAAK